jgi:mannose-6-phosphate isomerase-like protein (cupin superfamily)
VKIRGIRGWLFVSRNGKRVRIPLAEAMRMCFTLAMAKNSSRRNFLCTAPVAAAAGFALTHSLLSDAQTPVTSTSTPAPVPYQLFSATQLDEAVKSLATKGGNHNLVDQTAGFPNAVVLSTEIAKSAKEFEWHEGHDHIFVILDGATVYELGGTPKNGRNTKPGEWLAPDAEGATKVALKKGDILTIPRGVLHRRSTSGSVTFVLISTFGAIKA